MEKDNKVILVNQKNLTIIGIKKVLAVSETSISLLLETSTYWNIEINATKKLINKKTRKI